MKKKIFIWDTKSLSVNPINDRHYQDLLWLNPTLSDEIKKSVENVLFEDIVSIEKSELSSNEWIISQEEIDSAKKELLTELEQLENLTEKTKHIIVVIDSCFTNKVLLVLLRNILGKEAFLRYVQVVKIDYENPSNDTELEEYLASNHSLILLWWSLSDVYSMHTTHYDGVLARLIHEVGDDYYQKFLNKRILWVCFWQQFLANVIWVANKNSSWIIATVKGPSQFSPSNCIFKDLEFINPVYADVLKGVSNNGQNSEFTSVFTRNGYVKFDLLRTWGNLGIIPLITDQITGWIVGWWSKNGHILWVQFHPEIELLNNVHNLRKNIKEVIPVHRNQAEFLENFEVSDYVKRDIGEAFYVFALLWFIKDIKKTYLNLGSIYDDETEILEVEYDEAVNRLLTTTSKRVDYVLDLDQNRGEHDFNRDWIDSIDAKWRLLMNYILDWKVNRGIGEISEILWIKSVSDMIHKHIELQWSKNYIVRDMWAGDGNTVSELTAQIANKDVIVYGTWDYIYFDLYSCITKKTHFPEIIPDELIILFVEKIINEFKKIDDKSTIRKVKQSIAEIRFRSDDTIVKSSMTSKTTSMFENEDVSPLPPEIIENFESYLPVLDEMKEYIIKNFYNLFSSSFQKIYISKFSDLYIEDEVIGKVDFQFSIRATSHISGREYMKVISDYFYNSAKTGSIFIDNGIHQSYTSIPRLKELHDVLLDLVDSELKLIYDTKTNYFNSVIITKGQRYDDSFFQEHLLENTIIVPLKEAYQSTFFRLEYFVRNFIISNFKSHTVFWDYNKPIIDTLKDIMSQLEKKDTSNISHIILELINHIAGTYTNWGVKYNPISVDVLNNYAIDGERLIDIITQEVYTPEWMNIHANRKY